MEAKTNRDMTGAVLEYARGLSVVKSFGQSGASMEAFSEAVADSRKIHLKIEWGFIPANSLHLLALKCGSVALALAAFFMGMICKNPRKSRRLEAQLSSWLRISCMRLSSSAL